MFFSGESSGNKSPSEPPQPLIDGPWLSLSMTPFYPYVCPHCHGTFHNSQSLEGHQNAHRQECRDVIEELLAKMRTEVDFLNKFVSDHSAKNQSSTGRERYIGPVLCPKPIRTFKPPQSSPPPQPNHQFNLSHRLNMPRAPPSLWPETRHDHVGPVAAQTPNPPVSFRGLRAPNNINLPRDCTNQNVYEEFLAACRRSKANRKRGFEAFRAERDRNGSPEDSSCATSPDPIGWNVRSRGFDGNEVNSGGGELDLTLRL